MKICYKSRKGFTLVEMIMVISLLTLIITVVFSIFSFTNNAQNMTNIEYDIQSQIRVVSQVINTNVRFTSALFALPEITNISSLKGWNYITTTNIDANGYGDKVVEYLYDDSDPSNPTWRTNVIVESKANIKYNLNFIKENDYDVDKLIKFTISIKNFETGVERELETEVEALNSLQIIDRGSTNNLSKIICYRMDDRPLSAQAAISMVLDKSGSMNDDLNGNSTGDDSKRRINILKTKSENLVDSLSDRDNIMINIVPFSSSANNPKDYLTNIEGASYTANAYDKFLNASSDNTDLKADINKLSAFGGTNTGDGIRRGYYNLVTHYDYNMNINSDTEIKNYMVILVDGVSTFYTVKSKSDRSHVLDNQLKIDSRYLDRGGTVNNAAQVAGNGSSLDAGAEAYITAIGNKVKNASSIGGITTYVIGFSNKTADHGSLDNIGAATGAVESPANKKFFIATNDSELEGIFNMIKEDINRDLWHIYGPY